MQRITFIISGGCQQCLGIIRIIRNHVSGICCFLIAFFTVITVIAGKSFRNIAIHRRIEALAAYHVSQRSLVNRFCTFHQSLLLTISCSQRSWSPNSLYIISDQFVPRSGILRKLCFLSSAESFRKIMKPQKQYQSGHEKRQICASQVCLSSDYFCLAFIRIIPLQDPSVISS